MSAKEIQTESVGLSLRRRFLISKSGRVAILVPLQPWSTFSRNELPNHFNGLVLLLYEVLIGSTVAHYVRRLYVISRDHE